MAPGSGPKQLVGGEHGRRNDLEETGAQFWSPELPIKSQAEMSPYSTPELLHWGPCGGGVNLGPNCSSSPRTPEPQASEFSWGLSQLPLTWKRLLGEGPNLASRQVPWAVGPLGAKGWGWEICPPGIWKPGKYGSYSSGLTAPESGGKRV